MTVLRVFLVVCVLVTVGASADASASSTATGTWTLTVTFAGTGTELITSSPAGIVCTNVDDPNSPEGTCSAQFPDGVSPWVIATPSGFGSQFTTFSGVCAPELHHAYMCQPEQGPDGGRDRPSHVLARASALRHQQRPEAASLGRQAVPRNRPLQGWEDHLRLRGPPEEGVRHFSGPEGVLAAPARRGQPRGQRGQTRILGTALAQGSFLNTGPPSHLSLDLLTTQYGAHSG
jgi:hypothetical protein